MPYSFKVDRLIPDLKSHMSVVFKEGHAFGEDVISGLSEKTAGGVAAVAVSGSHALSRAIVNRIRRSKAHAQFQKRWDAAISDAEHEAALRSLLREDPRLARDLNNKLSKRNFVISMREHCEHLPRVALLDPQARLSEIYVALTLDSEQGERSALDGTTHSLSGDGLEDMLLQSGNHIIEGVAGSGKSTLARRLVIARADDLLKNSTLVSFDNERLPALVGASALLEGSDSFSEAIRRAVEKDLAFSGLDDLPRGFFNPTTVGGHSSWLLVIDGLDEIADLVQRQKFWDSLTMHAQTTKEFRFIVMSRPDAVRIRNGSPFSRWTINKLDASRQREIASSHIRDNRTLERFVERMAGPEYSEVVRLPLFAAMAAAVFRRHSDLPRLRSDLCELFVRRVLERARNPSLGPGTAISRLLEILACDPSADLARHGEAEPELVAAINPSVLFPLEFELSAKEALSNCGLGRFVGDRFLFNHDLFRSYFAAQAISGSHRPSGRIWESVDPFKVGWLVVEHVCIAWDRSGEKISPAVRALLSYGEDGLKCAIEVMVACGSVSNRDVANVTERLVQTLTSDGPFIWTLTALSRLARERPHVKQRLLGLIYQREDFLSSRVHAAECLMEAGFREDAVRALERLCRDRNTYGPDRVQAAELLLTNGERDVALAALSYEVENGEELWSQMDAACAILSADPSPQARQDVHDLLRYADESGEEIFGHTLGRLLELSEQDAALLPLLRNLGPKTSGFDGKVPRDAIEAARQLEKRKRGDGTRALKDLLTHDTYPLRGKAEIIEALNDLGEGPFARAAMAEALALASKESIDWFVLELMLELGMTDEAAALGKASIALGLEKPHLHSDWWDVFQRLQRCCDLDEFAEPLRRMLVANPSVRVASALAKLGHRNEAVEILVEWSVNQNLQQALNAMRGLANLGERNRAIRTAYQLAKTPNASPETRLRAAETLGDIGEHRWSIRAHTALLRDGVMPIKWRCRAASALNEADQAIGAIWDALSQYFLDDGNSLTDRLTAAKQLLATREDDWGDYDRYDLLADLWSMLEYPGLSASDRLRLGKMLARQGSGLSDLAPVSSALEEGAAPVGWMLSFLREVSRHTDDAVAEHKALEIIEREDASWRQVIDTCSCMSAPETQLISQTKLRDLAEGPTTPPTWRREAAEALIKIDPDLGAVALQRFMDDTAISVQERCRALEATRRGEPSLVRAGLLCLSNGPDLTVWEYLALADSALKFDGADIARRFLDSACQDEPLSVSEAVGLADRYIKIDAHDCAGRLLDDILALPDVVLEATEDTYALLDAARLLNSSDRRGDAVSLLVFMLDGSHASSFETPSIISALAELTTPEVLHQALGRCEATLLAALDDDKLEYAGGWLRTWSALEEHLKISHEPLWQIARNDRIYLGDRLEACERLQRLESEGNQRTKTIVAEIFEREVSRDHCKILSNAAAFERCGLEAEISTLVERLVEDPALDAPTLRGLAGILYARSETERAQNCLEQARALDPDEMNLGYFHHQLVETIEGKGGLQSALADRLWDDKEELYLRLDHARDLASDPGSRPAMRLILATLYDPGIDVTTRLRALEVLNELEFRAIPRFMIDDLRQDPEANDYWIADFLLRLGRKADALAALEKAIETCPDGYETQISYRLADLRAEDLLTTLENRSRIEEVDLTDERPRTAVGSSIG